MGDNKHTHKHTGMHTDARTDARTYLLAHVAPQGAVRRPHHAPRRRARVRATQARSKKALFICEKQIRQCKVEVQMVRKVGVGGKMPAALRSSSQTRLRAKTLRRARA